MRTLGSFNHTGLDEEPIAILLRSSAQCASMGYDPTIGGPVREAFPDRAVPCGTFGSYQIALIQGWVERLRETHRLAAQLKLSRWVTAQTAPNPPYQSTPS